MKSVFPIRPKQHLRFSESKKCSFNLKEHILVFYLKKDSNLEFSAFLSAKAQSFGSKALNSNPIDTSNFARLLQTWPLIQP